MKKKIIGLIAITMMLMACQTTPDAKPAASTENYRAIGTEPFWSLTLNGKFMLFSRAGERDISGDNTVSRPSFNGWRHDSDTITANVTFLPCNNGMSEQTYKDTVTVMIGKETYRGCGGGILPPASLERTAWRVTAINGAKISDTQGAMVAFGDGRMSGTIGCNRLGSQYTYVEGKLGFGPVMSTRMGCQEPLASQEFVFVTLLGSAFTTSFTNTGALVLAGKDGAEVILEQSI